MAEKVITFGEIMLRLAPEGYYRFVQADKYGVNYGGGEANVAVMDLIHILYQNCLTMRLDRLA